MGSDVVSSAAASFLGIMVVGILTTGVVVASETAPGDVRASISAGEATPSCRSRVSMPAPEFDQGATPRGPTEFASPAAEVHWIGPSDPDARQELELWCRGVGSAALHRPSKAPLTDSLVAAAWHESERADDLVVVTWNTHVGGGDLDGFLQDLRSGHLTGAPVARFVLLLQEVYRAGGDVPKRPHGQVKSADWIGQDAPRHGGSIDELARRHGLHLFYAPSMRNGAVDPNALQAPEDRGNAILSTEPLSNLKVLELPVERQRRAVVAATLRWSGSNGHPHALEVVSAHLDHMSGWRRIHRSLGAARAEHVRRLVDVFEGEDRIVVGGDFNTWFGGFQEEGIRLMRDHFPYPHERPSLGTLPHGVPFLSTLLVDYLFFRVPPGWRATYEVVPDTYGSDHRPLLGWVRAAL